jgi:uncharacterized repeat protein (TIGR01451 family)
MSGRTLAPGQQHGEGETAGSTARYSIAVTAVGTAPANNVVLTDALPSGLKWTIGTLMLASALPAHGQRRELR